MKNRQIHRGHGALVRTGLYRRIRHPQYAGFFLFLLGSSINWPTLVTLLMLPVSGGGAAATRWKRACLA